jgi:hypothetical protein
MTKATQAVWQSASSAKSVDTWIWLSERCIRLSMAQPPASRRRIVLRSLWSNSCNWVERGCVAARVFDRFATERGHPTFTVVPVDSRMPTLNAGAAEPGYNSYSPTTVVIRKSLRRVLGGCALMRERVEDMWRWTWIEQSGQDLRFAWRNLRRDRGFILLAVFTLALGIGATNVIFSVLDNALLRPFPYRDADAI